jgi:hypothetical protein
LFMMSSRGGVRADVEFVQACSPPSGPVNRGETPAARPTPVKGTEIVGDERGP